MMAGIFSGTNLYLLQTYFKQDDPIGAMVIGIGIGIVVLGVLIVNLVRHGLGAGSSTSPRRFNGFTLHRIASVYGLDKDQAKLLEFVFRNDAVADPERVMKNPAVLDRHFKRAYRVIEKGPGTDEAIQQQMLRLFSLRNAIEAAPADSGPSSTRQLPENTSAIINTGTASYPVRVISSKGDSITVEAPGTAGDTEPPLPRGSPVSITFFTKSAKGFSFDTYVLGTNNTTRGTGLQLAHSEKPKTLSQRGYRRKKISAGCEFYFVKAGGVKEGRGNVDTRRFTGTVVDISSGGCSIKTISPVQAGSRLKIDVECSLSPMITVQGQVLRTNRSGAAGTILHIKFFEVPRRAFNTINALVFEYNEE
jgi:c-di-GMP-binding flagellar brake protein YcgR